MFLKKRDVLKFSLPNKNDDRLQAGQEMHRENLDSTHHLKKCGTGCMMILVWQVTYY